MPFGFGSSSPTVGSQAFFNSVRSPTPSSKQRTSLGVSSSSDSSATSFSPSGSRIPQYNGIISQRTALAGSETDLHRSKSNRGSTSPSHVTSLENIPPDRLDTRQEHEDFDDFDAASMPRPQSQASIPASAFSSPRKSKRRSYVPVPAALNSAALSNGPATTPIANTPSSSSTHSVRSNGSANTKAGGVFFGSSDQAGARHAARVASAASGTGKVLSDLQFDLSTARGALETTKQTLRITQGACESLLRSKEELSGHVDNLRLENEGINKMLVRKERMLSEANERADKAEQRVQEQTTVAKERDARATQLESQAEEMRHRTLHAESQYEALGGGLQAAKEGWSRQVQALRKNQEDMQRQHAQQLEEALKTHDMCA